MHYQLLSKIRAMKTEQSCVATMSSKKVKGGYKMKREVVRFKFSELHLMTDKKGGGGAA